jgi:ABC-type uncharacterized transport system auxiliary subunit
MSRIQSILGASIAALLSACALAPTPEDAFYRLEVSPPANSVEAPILQGTLEVDAFRTDPLTSGRAMLYRNEGTPSRVHRLPYTFWMDAPAAMLQREAAEYLRAAGVALRVVTPSARTNADYALVGTIVRLEQIRSAAPSVVIELELALVERGSRNLLQHGVYSEEVAATKSDVAGTVDAFGRALSSILERFVADLTAS